LATRAIIPRDRVVACRSEVYTVTIPRAIIRGDGDIAGAIEGDTTRIPHESIPGDNVVIRGREINAKLAIQRAVISAN